MHWWWMRQVVLSSAIWGLWLHMNSIFSKVFCSDKIFSYLFFPSQFPLQTLSCVQFRVRKWWRWNTCRRPSWHKPFKKRSTMMQRHLRGLLNRLHSKQIGYAKCGRLSGTAIGRRAQGGRADYINTAGRGHWNWRLSILNKRNIGPITVV